MQLDNNLHDTMPQAYLREDMTFPFGYRGSQKVMFKKGTRCIVMEAATRKVSRNRAAPD